ncbi:MAG: MAPEG family protein [Burkholderiales bacterium]|nr:MAPEG family protein [Burkholderiales bacterium]
MPVTPLYAALLALIFVGLSIRTIRLRRRYRVGVGDGNHAELQRAARVHANFAEYVPLALLLVYFAETGGGPLPLIHALAIALLCGRLLHAWGVSQVRENYRYRTAGMVLTFSVIISGSLFLLFARLF